MIPQQSVSQDPTSKPAIHYRVVAGYDFSPLGDRAVLEALQIGSQHPAAALHVITVAAESPAGLILPGGEPHFISANEARQKVQTNVAKIIDGFLERTPAPGIDKV